MYMREVDNPVMIQYIILFTLAKAARRVTHSQLTCLTLDNCNINFANFLSFPFSKLPNPNDMVSSINAYGVNN